MNIHTSQNIENRFSTSPNLGRPCDKNCGRLKNKGGPLGMENTLGRVKLLTDLKTSIFVFVSDLKNRKQALGIKKLPKVGKVPILMEFLCWMLH